VTRLERLHGRLAPLKTALLEHPLYHELDDLQALHVFMEHHVFAVWDFMSLPKALQRRLCCRDVPWLPSADPDACRFINEVVLAEESDDDGQGGFLSHFSLYRRAMIRCGANITAIDRFLAAIRTGMSVDAALNAVDVPACVGRFVRQTFDCIECGEVAAIASAFTFGREDLLPGIFQRIVDEVNVQSTGALDDFRFYLHRHIGLDGEEHGPMASRLIASLCGADEARWQTVEQAAIAALQARQDLWDGMAVTLRRRKDGAARTT
jgi:hypothetical protein